MGKDKFCVSKRHPELFAYRNPMIPNNVGSTRSESGPQKFLDEVLARHRPSFSAASVIQAMRKVEKGGSAMFSRNRDRISVLDRA
jgi:hypothetical protein